MEFRWQVNNSAPESTVQELQNSLGVEELIARLLVQRGVTTFDEAKQFFRPNTNHLHDPFLMKDMDKAVARIEEALEEDQRILIYGDYDVDGTTSVALMYTFLKNLCPDNLDYYVPDRYKEGYGVSFQGVDYAEETHAQLIIALDCGIRAHEKVNYAKEKGIDFIICDHHLPHGDIPNAVAVLDHKRQDCPYPYKELSGCGIGFKLCQALAQTYGMPDQSWQSLLDLVAISSACDIVPITDENRALVAMGLQELNKNPRLGFRNIIENSKRKPFRVSDVVFVLGPRINAAGRIEHAKKAVELLLSDNDELATKASEVLEERNQERRELDQSITLEALDVLHLQAEQEPNKTTSVVFSEEWHKGVVGIVASRLTEHYYRPTIVLTQSGDKAVGSARSVKGFDIHEALLQCSDYLEQFGGHAFAAGMTLGLDKIDAFAEKFEEVVAKSIDRELLIPTMEIDAEINFSDITPKFWRLIQQFAPFGPGNMKPVFVTHNVVDAGWCKAVGDGTHLKLDIKQKGSPHRSNGIAFGFGEHESRIKAGDSFSLVYTIEENVWQGQVSLQLMVKDLRFEN